MASPTQDRTATLGLVAAGAAAGALVAYYLASRPAVRRVAWQVLKATLTTSLPAIVFNELQPRGDELPGADDPEPVLQD